MHPDKRIVDFINEHHVLTLATSLNNNPYCAHCFYIYNSADNEFVFTSASDTKHICDVASHNVVGGAIVLETKMVGKVQGLQFQGVLTEAKDDKLKVVKKAYLKKFPYAAMSLEALWILKVSFFKLSDNRLGFGKKLIWGNLVQ